MPTGVYPRTKYHRRINSEAHKLFFKDNPEARRRISVSVMRYYNLKKLED